MHFLLFALQNQVHISNQLTHSQFIKSLAELAIFLKLENVLIGEPRDHVTDQEAHHNWSWFSTLCKTAQVTDALFKRATFPSSFVEEFENSGSLGLVCVLNFIVDTIMSDHYDNDGTNFICMFVLFYPK